MNGSKGEPKKVDVVLLGAGASIDAGIPGAIGLADALIKGVGNDPSLSVEHAALEYIWERLKTGPKQTRALKLMRESGNHHFDEVDDATEASPDVETLMQVLEGLRQRGENPIDWFVAAWDPVIRELASNGHLSIGLLKRRLEKELLRTAWPDVGADVSYLEPLLRGASAHEPAEIFSLNYDNVVERAAASLQMELQYGLSPRYAHERRVRFGDGQAPVRLLKLHGSVNWRRFRTAKTSPALGPAHPNPTIEILADDNVHVDDGERALVFGDANKLSADYPFFETFLYLRERLESAATALVIGYSGRDKHINSLFQRHFNDAVFCKLIIVDPNAEQVAEAMLPELRNKGSLRNHPRLRLIHAPAREGITQALQIEQPADGVD